MARYRVTVDTGGTFSDFVYLNEETGEVSIAKVPSTPDDPSRAILARRSRRCWRRASRADDIGYLLPRHHGRHQRAARRQGRPDRPAGDRRLPRHLSGGRAGAALRRGDLRRHVRQAAAAGARRAAPARCKERVDFRGDVLRPLDEAALRETVRELKAQNIESIAVCLLFSFLHPAARGARARHRRSRKCRAAASRSRREMLPQIREYYRLSTTVINAYLQPILARYIAQLDQRLAERRHRHAAEIHHAVERRHGDLRRRRAQGAVTTVLSGPAGGVTAGALRLPHDRICRTSSPSTWAAPPATSR